MPEHPLIVYEGDFLVTASAQCVLNSDEWMRIKSKDYNVYLRCSAPTEEKNTFIESEIDNENEGSLKITFHMPPTNHQLTWRGDIGASENGQRVRLAVFICTVVGQRVTHLLSANISVEAASNAI